MKHWPLSALVMTESGVVGTLEMCYFYITLSFHMTPGTDICHRLKCFSLMGSLIQKFAFCHYVYTLMVLQTALIFFYSLEKREEEV